MIAISLYNGCNVLGISEFDNDEEIEVAYIYPSGLQCIDVKKTAFYSLCIRQSQQNTPHAPSTSHVYLPAVYLVSLEGVLMEIPSLICILQHMKILHFV